MKISPLAWLHREFSLPPSWTSQFVMQGKEKFTIFKVKRFSFFFYHPSLNPSIMWEKYAVHKVWREIQFAFCMKIYDLELPTYFITIMEGSTVTHFHIIMGLICTV